MADKKQKRVIARRDAGASRFQLPAREPREHDASFVGDLIKDANAQSQVSPNLAHTKPSPDLAQPQAKSRPIAPERNYNKRANSLDHEALPAGLFPGASKKIYDALYVRTRGAITPTRTVQTTHRELMRWSGIKDVKTIKTHLRKLNERGLISWRTLKGEHEGSFFEVVLPEEVSPSLAQSEAKPSPILEMGSDLAQKTDWAGLGNLVENKNTSADPKTSFKTIEQNDDEFGQRLRALERELTGKSSPSAKWMPLFELLADELKNAASRTGSVSDAPAFFAEHLRRRLTKPDAPTRRGEVKSAVATEPTALATDEIAPPAPEEVEEFERARAELEGK